MMLSSCCNASKLSSCCEAAKFAVLTKELRTDEKDDCAFCVKWKCVGGMCTDQEIVSCKPSELNTCCEPGKLASRCCCVCVVFKGGRCVEVKTVSCGGSGGQVQEHKSFAAEIEQQQKVKGGNVGSAVCVYTSPPKMGGNVEVKLCSSNELNEAGKCCQGMPNCCCVLASVENSTCKVKLYCPLADADY